MSLKDKIQSDMKEAMKAKDMDTVNALRLVISAVKKREIDDKVTFSDADVTKLLGSLVKQRLDSIEAFKKGNRADLVEKEEKELSLLRSYLPKQVSEDTIRSIVDSVISETGAKGMKDMGKVMPKVLEKLAGAADGKTVSEIVRSKLG